MEYALSGMDNDLFVSKYQLELPEKEEMQRVIEEQVKQAANRSTLPVKPAWAFLINGKNASIN